VQQRHRILDGCWSGDAPEAHKFRQRRTSYTRGAQVPTTAGSDQQWHVAINNCMTTPKELNLSSSKIIYKK
ncbi:MAG: hypothetical protein ACK52X_04465, partial [bacterium]